jgi:hypothetical protein
MKTEWQNNLMESVKPAAYKISWHKYTGPVNPTSGVKPVEYKIANNNTVVAHGEDLAGGTSRGWDNHKINWINNQARRDFIQWAKTVTDATDNDAAEQLAVDILLADAKI